MPSSERPEQKAEIPKPVRYGFRSQSSAADPEAHRQQLDRRCGRRRPSWRSGSRVGRSQHTVCRECRSGARNGTARHCPSELTLATGRGSHVPISSNRGAASIGVRNSPVQKPALGNSKPLMGSCAHGDWCRIPPDRTSRRSGRRWRIRQSGRRLGIRSHPRLRPRTRSCPRRSNTSSDRPLYRT